MTRSFILNLLRVLTLAGLAVLTWFVCVLPSWTGATLIWHDYVHGISWRERTSPLPSHVVQDLCHQFGLPASDARCQPNAVVYAPEFFKSIEETLQPSNGHGATFDEVENKIGIYQYECEPTTTVTNGVSYFVCSYDLNGDRVHPISIFFYSDGTIWKIIADPPGW